MSLSLPWQCAVCVGLSIFRIKFDGASVVAMAPLDGPELAAMPGAVGARIFGSVDSAIASQRWPRPDRPCSSCEATVRIGRRIFGSSSMRAEVGYARQSRLNAFGNAAFVGAVASFKFGWLACLSSASSSFS